MNSRRRKTKFKLTKIKIALSVIIFLGVLRGFLPLLLKHYINRQLNRDPLYHGNVDDVTVSLWRGAYTLEELKIEKVSGQRRFPLIAADEVFIGLGWHEIFRGSAVAVVNVKNIEINLVAEPTKATPDGENKSSTKVSVGASSKADRKHEASNWHSVFKNLIPLNINRLSMVGKSIHYRDLGSNPKIDVFMDQLVATGENLTNSLQVSKNLFGTIDLKARVMHSGRLQTHVKINPIQTPLEIKLSLEMLDLNLVELNNFFTAYGKFDVKEGRFDLFSEIAIANNKIEGYVKPLIRNLNVAKFSQDDKKGILHAFWEQIVGTIGAIFKNFPKNRQAAKIPFSGSFDHPHVDVWATLGSILQNMLIKPISPSTDHSIKLDDIKTKK